MPLTQNYNGIQSTSTAPKTPQCCRYSVAIPRRLIQHGSKTSIAGFASRV